MITIFKNKLDIPNDMEYIELNDLFFNQNTSVLIDKRAEKFIETIDDAKLIGKYKILSRFDDVAIDIDRLSSGCKTVLNVLYYPDKVFCLKECGNNALEILYHLEKRLCVQRIRFDSFYHRFCHGRDEIHEKDNQ